MVRNSTAPVISLEVMMELDAGRGLSGDILDYFDATECAADEQEELRIKERLKKFYASKLAPGLPTLRRTTTLKRLINQAISRAPTKSRVGRLFAMDEALFASALEEQFRACKSLRYDSNASHLHVAEAHNRLYGQNAGRWSTLDKDERRKICTNFKSALNRLGEEKCEKILIAKMTI